MQIKQYQNPKIHKSLFPFFFLIIVSCFFISCGKEVDVSGTYRKVSGEYRYDYIKIEKINNNKSGNKYNITTIHEGQKKFKTTSALEDKTMQLGFIAPIKFYPGYKKFFLELGKGSFFEKEIGESGIQK